MIDGKLKLTDWSFLPDNAWTFDASFDATPIDAMQQLVDINYPVHGKLTGQFHGRGTRREPNVSGLFDLADGEVYGVIFNRLRGQLTATRDEVRIADAELRLFPPGTEASRGAGIVTGTAEYRMTDKNVSVDLVGASIPLANFSNLQTERFPVDGLISFRIKATGPATSPEAEGNFRVVDLRVGQAVIGSFEGDLNSDGKRARLTLSSSMTTGGELSGAINLGLSDPFNLDGKVAIKNIDLDPFLARALHVDKFEGHGSAEGEIAINGALRHPESIVVDAAFSHLEFNYASVHLENAGPIHFRSSRDNLEIVSAGFRGPNTNMTIAGNVQFAGSRALNLQLNGAVDLRFVSSFRAGSHQQRFGGSERHISPGRSSNPSITGNIHIENACGPHQRFPDGAQRDQGRSDFRCDAAALRESYGAGRRRHAASYRQRELHRATDSLRHYGAQRQHAHSLSGRNELAHGGHAAAHGHDRRRIAVGPRHGGARDSSGRTRSCRFAFFDERRNQRAIDEFAVFAQLAVRYSGGVHAGRAHAVARRGARSRSGSCACAERGSIRSSSGTSTCCRAICCSTEIAIAWRAATSTLRTLSGSIRS